MALYKREDILSILATHTLNPVPAVLIAAGFEATQLRSEGALADVDSRKRDHGRGSRYRSPVPRRPNVRARINTLATFCGSATDDSMT